MRKIALIVLVSIAGFLNNVKADEGMWLPFLVERLNYVDMKKMGLQLTADEIYSVNNSSLKDAIVSLNNGNCSAFMVSGEGLMMTNHHCGLEYIQRQSSTEMDYVEKGFWAMSKAEELRNEKITASFLVKVENVTDKILPELKGITNEMDRDKKVHEISEKLIGSATGGTEYNAEVKSFFNGNEYYMFVYITYKDVRLVGAPSSSMANFGADADNWQWPRENSEFTLFRIYTSPQGKPAEYNKKNIPLVPKKFLPISLKGVKKDDFMMTLGYPTVTDRYMTSYGVKMQIDEVATAFIDIRDAKLKIMKAAMDANEDTKIQYVSKYNSSSNYWKYYVGQKEILLKLKEYDKKKELETRFIQWINQDPKLKAKYSEAIPTIEKAYEGIQKYIKTRNYLRQTALMGFEIAAYANLYEELFKELSASAPDQEKINRMATSLKYQSTKYFKSYKADLDKKVFVALMQMVKNEVPKELLPDIFELIDKKYKGDIQKYADEVFEKSMFANKDKVQEFLTAPSYKIIEKDLGYKAMQSLYGKYNEVEAAMKPFQLQLETGNRLFVAGIVEMDKDKKIYPNANSTMRFSYGKVDEYNKANGKNFTFFTTSDDLLSKYKAKDRDFDLPERLVKMMTAKDFGRYGKDGKMNICFITNNDITGGNSGSPIINAKGELSGILFDINWEATASSIAFEPELQRTICVDMRYVLWVIDKYAGATNLISEMKIIE